MKKTSAFLSVLLVFMLLFSTVTFAADPFEVTSVTCGQTDLTTNEAKVSGDAEIAIVFSKNVTDESVFETNKGKISIKDSSGTKVTAAVAAGSDKNTVTVTLGSLAEGDYTLVLGKDITAKSGDTLAKTEYTFKVKSESGSGQGGSGESVTALEITSVTSGAADITTGTAQVAGDAEIAIVFSKNVTDESVFEANKGKISVKDSSGTKVTATVAAGSDKNTVTVTLGSLADGDYTLVLGKDITAKSGDTLAKTEYAFKVKSESGSGQGGSGESSKALEVISVSSGETSLMTGTPKISGDAEIIIVFSKNVTDDSVININIAKISVKNSSGAKVNSSVSAGSDKNTLVVSLGSLEKGNYTLTLGQEVQAKSGDKLGTKAEYAFEVKGDGSGSGGGNNPLEVTSVTVNGENISGKDLQGTEKIVILFSRGMTENEAANKEQIKVYCGEKEASYIIGAVYDKSYVEITLNNPQPGNYTLKLGKDIKANNGNTLGEDCTYDFTVRIADVPEPSLIDTIIAAVSDFIDSVVATISSLLDAIFAFFKSIFA